MKVRIASVPVGVRVTTIITKKSGLVLEHLTAQNRHAGVGGTIVGFADGKRTLHPDVLVEMDPPDALLR